DVMSGKIGAKASFLGVVEVGGELSTSSKESEAWYQNLSKDQKETFDKTFNESLSNEIGKNRDANSSF
ncbi:TPA: hypothetical protein SCP46_001839, partial [Campylobacter jejuni]|nr:hypothetical protein [Campylobacter jejuni]